MEAPTRNPMSRHAICGALAAGAFALSVIAVPAQAELVLETDQIYCGGNSPTCQTFDADRRKAPHGTVSNFDEAAAAANSLLPQFPRGVDLIGKWDGDDGEFESGGATNAAGDVLFTDAAITLSYDNDDDLWNWELTERTAIWDVVKIGIKQAKVKAYFLVDPGADSGSFNIVDLFNDAGGSGGDLAGWFNGSPSNAFSHVSFFGTNTIPEPGVIALLGMGLVGFAVIRRRRRTI